MKILHWIKDDLIWQVGNGERIRVGVDPIIGMEENFALPQDIIQYLQILGMNTLDKIHLQQLGFAGISSWLSARDIGLSGYLARTWDDYLMKLNASGIRLNQDSDQLLWKGNPANGLVTARSAYYRIVQDKLIYPQDWWYKRLWHWSIPLKLKCFCWLLLQNKLKTWDNLRARGWNGPGICILCKEDEENKQHLFVKCRYTLKIWDVIMTQLTVYQTWDVGDFNQCLLNWYRNCKQHFNIAICISWAIWYSRNCELFQNVTINPTQCSMIALNMFAFCKDDVSKLKTDRISTFSFKVDQPIIFFDGASQSGLCAVGGVIYLNESHHFTFKLNCGTGTNMKAELIALWCMLKVANIFGLVNIKVFGDSKVTIKWAAGDFQLNVLNLRHWALRAQSELAKLQAVQIEHIYREQNSLADKLSKHALTGYEGQLIWEEWVENNLQDEGNIYFFD